MYPTKHDATEGTDWVATDFLGKTVSSNCKKSRRAGCLVPRKLAPILSFLGNPKTHFWANECIYIIHQLGFLAPKKKKELSCTVSYDGRPLPGVKFRWPKSSPKFRDIGIHGSIMKIPSKHQISTFHGLMKDDWKQKNLNTPNTSLFEFWWSQEKHILWHQSNLLFDKGYELRRNYFRISAREVPLHWRSCTVSCEASNSSQKRLGGSLSYCWWFRNPANQLIW